MPEQKIEVELPESFTKLTEKMDAIAAQIAKLEGGEKPESGVLTPELTTLKADFAKVEKELAAARVELQKQLEDTTKELTESKAEVVKIRLARRREKFIKAVQPLTDLPGAPADDFAEIVEKCESALTPKQFEKLFTLLTSWNAILAKSKIFEEIGRTEIGAFTGAEGQLHALAKELQAANPKLSYPKAYTQATLEHPELYKRYRAEKES